MKRRPTDSNTEGKKDTGMLKYIRNQVTSFNFWFVFIPTEKMQHEEIRKCAQKCQLSKTFLLPLPESEFESALLAEFVSSCIIYNVIKTRIFRAISPTLFIGWLALRLLHRSNLYMKTYI